ncbi:MAG: DUF3488 domain-containing protein [Myxococcales bacterium]|nr:DUF3488 domain-containing protein [Myxococcales bacterium]
MRFSAIHKVSSYLMVASAFAVLLLSGELPSAWLLFTLLGGAASFFIEPSRMRFARSVFWQRAWNVATLGVFAWLVEQYLTGETLIMTGVRFLCFLLVNKLANRRSSKDYLQAYVVSFLMLVAGTTLNTDLVYALCFLAYVAFATWTLTLFHLRREMEENYLLKHSEDAQSERVEVERILNSRRVVGPAFLAGTSLVSAGIFLGSTLIFFLFPRVGLGVFFSHSRAGLRMGFNDSGVELGQNGLIKENDQVVMRIEFPKGRPKESLYLRGIAFERYSSDAAGRFATWSPAPTSPRTGRHELPRIDGVSLMRMPADRATVPRLLEQALRQEVYLEPMGNVSVVFAVVSPFGFQMPPRQVGAPPEAPDGDGVGDVFAGDHQSGLKYTAWSLLGRPPDAALDAEPDLPEGRVERMRASLQLPSDLPPRIIELARTVTKGAQGPHQKVQAVMRYLRTNYTYTTQLGRDYRYDPLEDFLFIQKAGHCEYFATALAIMLRAVGVPTRHVAGFYGGDWNTYGGYLQVRQRDAHAWAEVYLGSAGWVTFDPTPPVVAGMGEPGGLRLRLREMLDTLQLAWFKYVIEYDVAKQVDILQGIRKWWRSDGGGGKDRGKGLGQGGATRAGWLYAHRRQLAIGASVCAFAGYFWWRRRRGGPASDRAPARRRLQVAGAFERATRAVERRTSPRGPAETPTELCDRAALRSDPGALPYRELVDLYYAARFGGEAVDRVNFERLAREVVKARIAPSPTAKP